MVEVYDLCANAKFHHPDTPEFHRKHSLSGGLNNEKAEAAYIRSVVASPPVST